MLQLLLQASLDGGLVSQAMLVQQAPANLAQIQSLMYACDLQLAKRRLEQLVHVLPESIKQRTLHLHILTEQLHVARGHR